MPLHATSSGVCHFKWRDTSSGVPLRVAYATSSGVPLQVAYASSSGVPLGVACRAVSMPLHVTSSGSCHFEWRVAL